eukprot:6180204-Pleurochrysis_carterae.AAC.6
MEAEAPQIQLRASICDVSIRDIQTDAIQAQKNAAFSSRFPSASSLRPLHRKPKKRTADTQS